MLSLESPPAGWLVSVVVGGCGSGCGGISIEFDCRGLSTTACSLGGLEFLSSDISLKIKVNKKDQQDHTSEQASDHKAVYNPYR